MARITRVTAIPFGLNGSTDDFETFGSTAEGAADFSKDPAAIQATADWLLGWRPALISAKAPVLQDMNGKMLVDSNLLCYLFQEGIAEYDSATTYYKGGIVKNLANTGYIELYVSITDANVGNALPTRVDDANWAFLFAFRISTNTLIYGQSISFNNNGTRGIVGTTTNDDAPAGDVGQELRTFTSGTAAAASGVFDDCGSLALTAGDWDVCAILHGEYNGGTWSSLTLGISPNSGNNSSGLTDGDNMVIQSWSNSNTNPLSVSLAIPQYRVKLATPTTYYLKRRFVYSAGAPASDGCRISARRVR